MILQNYYSFFVKILKGAIERVKKKNGKCVNKLKFKLYDWKTVKSIKEKYVTDFPRHFGLGYR
jgi:hypothetical protein